MSHVSIQIQNSANAPGKRLMLKLLIFSLIATPAVADSITPSLGLSAITDAIRSGAKEVHLSKGVFLLPETLTLSAEANGVRLIGTGHQTVLSGARKAGPWELVDREREHWRCKSPLAEGRASSTTIRSRRRTFAAVTDAQSGLVSRRPAFNHRL